MFDIRKMQENVIYEAVKAESNADIAREVVYGIEGDGKPGDGKPGNGKPGDGKSVEAKTDNNPDWIKSVMHRLEGRFEFDTVKKIRMNCQCGYGMDEKLALVKELMSTAANLEEFAGSEKAKDAGLFCKDGALFLQFHVCPCPMLAGVDRLETSTWCQCTTGYSKVLFETAFSCKADVELLKSIKMGDEVCLMKIALHNPVWPLQADQFISDK